MSWPLRVSGINSSPKLIEQGIGSYGNGVFSGVGSDANNLKSTMNYNSGANEVVNGTVGSIESFSGIGKGLSLLKTKSQVASVASPPKVLKTVPTNPSIVTSSENPVGFLSYKIFGIPVYIFIIIAIIALIVGFMVLK